ncbi:MAG: phosphoglycerate dehydrogenase [Bacteroidota bacterium]|nr:phosphoglycerate dehydrogenase [Bacteroidota bacterium]
MLNSIEEFRQIFTNKNIELVTPDVVQVLSEAQLIELVPQADAWIIGDDPATEKVFIAGKKGKLKCAVKWGVGTDNVDFEACKKLDIPIANTPHMFGGEVADLAMAYLLGLARHSYLIDKAVKRGEWIKPTAISVAGKNVFVAGLGDIGRSLIKRLQGFDVNTYAYDPFALCTAEEAGVKEILNFPDLLGQADFLVLCCSLTASSRHMINAISIASMKNGIFVINVARGGLIDEAALTEGLQSGKIAAAALDVFETEPLPLESGLRGFDQCIFGTHNGSNTTEAVRRASNKAIEILFQFLNIG